MMKKLMSYFTVEVLEVGLVGLIFITLPVAFSNMPGGDSVGLLFFVLLLFAAWTTAIGMLEPVIAWLVEKFQGHRAKLTLATALLAWLLGLASVYSFGILSEFYPLGFLNIEKTFFEIVDFGTANVLLPLNALLIALFAGWALRESTALDELGHVSGAWFSAWRAILRYAAPIAIAIVIVDLVT